MVQLDVGGSMTFWHRTSGAKLNPHKPLPPWAGQAQYVSVPLQPRQAMDVHGGGLCLGGATPSYSSQVEISACFGSHDRPWVVPAIESITGPVPATLWYESSKLPRAQTWAAGKVSNAGAGPGVSGQHLRQARSNSACPHKYQAESCCAAAGCRAPFMLEVTGCQTRGRDLVSAVSTCGLDTEDIDGPVPAFPLAAFPGVQAAVAAAWAAFQSVQVAYLEGRILLGNVTSTGPPR